MSTDVIVKAGQESEAYQEARSFEANAEKSSKDTIKRQNKVITALAVVCVGQSVALATLVPLKQPAFPVLIGLDKIGGTTEVLEAVNDRSVAPYQELIDKHWAQRYVVARESYNYKLLQTDYDTVLLLSSDDVGRDYAKLYDGADARDKKYGNSLEMRVKVLSISLSHDAVGNKAVVRYEKTVKRTDAEMAEPPQYYVATLSYEFKPSMRGKEADLVANPMGYKVTGWRVDAELAPVKGKA